MRTTVTLDDDLAAKLRARAKERDVPFKVALSDALRAGLGAGAARSTPYRMPVRSLGLRPGVDLDRALSLAAEIEDAEMLRKLDLRK